MLLETERTDEVEIQKEDSLVLWHEMKGHFKARNIRQLNSQYLLSIRYVHRY